MSFSPLPSLTLSLIRSTPGLRVAALLATLSPLFPSPAQGQLRETGPILLDLPASTRALSLGNAFALGFDDSDVIFYHPGDLSRAQGFSGGMQWFGSSSILATLSAAADWLSGGVGLGIQHLSYGAKASQPPAGSDLKALPADVGSLRDEGDVGVSELIVSAGYGRTLKGIRVGAVGKLISQRFGQLDGTAGAVDLGASVSPGPLTVGLSIQNLGRDLEMGGEKIPLPRSFSLGATTERAWVGPLDLAASGAVEYWEGGEVVPSLGLEVAYWPVTGRTFSGRVGVRKHPEEQSTSAFTFGAGFQGDDLVLDYAYQGFDEGHPSHRLTIGWR